MSKRKKLKPLKGGVKNLSPELSPVADAATEGEPIPATVDEATPSNDELLEMAAKSEPPSYVDLETVAVDADGEIKPIEEVSWAKPEVMNAERTLAAASDKLDEITVRTMADMFEWFGMDVIHDPDFPYANTLREKGGDPSFANAQAMSLARTMHLDRRRASIDQQKAINRDGTTPMWCVQIGHSELDPALNPDFLAGVHPSKHAHVLKDFPILDRTHDAKVECKDEPKSKVTKNKPADPSPATPPKSKEGQTMKVKRSLLNKMFSAMGFNVPDQWSSGTMIKNVKTLAKITTQKELAKVKKVDKELLSLLKSLINLIEEDRFDEIVIVTDSKTATKQASKQPVKASKRSRDEEDEDEADDDSEDDSEDESEEDESEDEDAGDEDEDDAESDDDEAEEEEDESDSDEEESDEEDEETEDDEDERPRRGSKKSPVTKPGKKGTMKKVAKNTKPSKPTKEKQTRRDKYAELLPKPGSFLKRIYKGNEIKVRVERDGFTWKNKKYDTIRAVAEAITQSDAGTNGWRFFGLIK